MNDKTSFGADPERVDRLLAMGLEGADSNEDVSIELSWDRLLDKPGGRIGQYKLLRVLGEGGMGIVYLAEQEEPIKRRVALKVIKPDMDSNRVVTRFEAERQTLALLDHPNIAHVYDAGTTQSGRPYFIMEYVKGLSITEYCDQHKLNIEKRLTLFQQICHAVHHAHQKGIIHRDIKPSNILVSTVDDQAMPKIIDFGVAKAISQPLTERTLFTERGQLFGTPEYMSPEQAEMVNEDIDIRSDIYSLGVLLYVLLTGVLPFDSDTLRTGGIENIRKIIRETSPKTPSTRLIKLGEQAKKIAESRHTEVTALARCLHRELEWIPLKAMQKERSERYRSASEFADDIENYLKGNPLIAGPVSKIYRVKKFVRRHKALVTGIASVLTVLVAGIIVSIIFAVGQARARDRAQEVSNFLHRIVLGSLNQRYVMGKEITARSALDAISQELESKFQDQPLFEAQFRQTLASAYGVLGLYEPAESNAMRAFEICQTQLGTETIAAPYSWYQLGWLYMLQCRLYEAEPLLTKALEEFKLVLKEEHEDRLCCMAFLGLVYNYQGRFTEAEKLFKEALSTAHRCWATEDRALFFLYCFALSQHMQGRYKEAERLYFRGLKISLRVRSERDQDTLLFMHGLGELRMNQGRYEEAEKLLCETLTHRREAWGEEHLDTLNTMAVIGWLYYRQGRYEQAREQLLKTEEVTRRVLGDEHLYSLKSMHGLGTLYLSQGRYDEAEPLLKEALEISNKIMGKKNWYALRVINTLAKLYMAQGKSDEAESLFEQTLAGRLSKLGEAHPETLETKNDLAVLYKEQARYGEAEELLLEAIEGGIQKLSTQHPHTQESIKTLIDLYQALNKPDQADIWREKLLE